MGRDHRRSSHRGSKPSWVRCRWEERLQSAGREKVLLSFRRGQTANAGSQVLFAPGRQISGRGRLLTALRKPFSSAYLPIDPAVPNIVLLVLLIIAVLKIPCQIPSRSRTSRSVLVHLVHPPLPGGVLLPQRHLKPVVDPPLLIVRVWNGGQCLRIRVGSNRSRAGRQLVDGGEDRIVTGALPIRRYGNPVTKSIDKSFQQWVGIGSDSQ